MPLLKPVCFKLFHKKAGFTYKNEVETLSSKKIYTN